MKIVQKKLDNLFLKAGQLNKYQYIIVTLFTLQFLCSQFFHVNFIYINSQPRLTLNETETKLDTRVCEKYFTEISPIPLIQNNNQLASSTIIIDFDLACQSIKIYFISIVYYFGNMLGSCITYHFYEKVGSRISFNLFTIIQIVSIFCLEFLNINSIAKNIYILYIILFIIGVSQYVVVNLIFLYICDIVSSEHIPIFVTIIVCGRTIASLLGVFFFENFNMNWKHDMAIIAGVNIIIFFLTLSYMEKSPKAALRNNEYMNFVKYLLKIAIKNGKILGKKDFDFLTPFMNINEKIEFVGYFNIHEKNNINNQLLDENNIKDDNDSDDEEFKDLVLKINNKKEEENTILKDEYLLSDENNKIGSVNTLFSKVKMKDYYFLDFFKFRSHLINFSILSFLWAVYNLIKYGIQSAMDEFPQYYNFTYWRLIAYILELITLFLMMVMYMINQKASFKILITIEIICFLIIALAEYIFNDPNIGIYTYVTTLLICKVIWSSLYLLFIIIALLVYPIMLRSKGLGWNIALGVFGKLAVTFIIDLEDKNEYLLYILLFNFLMLVFSNGLPSKIGSLQIDLAGDKNKKFSEKILKDDKEEDEDDNINNIENIIIEEKNEMKDI